MLKFAVLTIATTYVLLVAVMYLAQRSLLYPGAWGANGGLPTPAPWGERATIPTKDGERLAALLARPADAKAIFLFFHGNADNIGAYDFLADSLAARGYGLLAVSFRGYAGSTGFPTEAGLFEDGLAAFDWLSALEERLPVIILGRSLGTGVAVNTAAERNAAAMILISSYTSIAAIAQSAYWYLLVRALIKDPFRADLRIGRVPAPKLLLHGELDRIIPLRFGTELFTLAPQPKSFVVLKGVGHNDIWTQDLVGQITAFADRTLAERPAH